ncbi:MAG: MATE family efflux transporter [Deltaproteobacteria bacterium]|nr:MATE family efflux transporter [Deltaproteobacteria bacterium]
MAGAEDARARTSTEPAQGAMREVVSLAYPLVLTQISITAMSLADSAIVGRLGAAPLAAVGLGGNWIWTFASFFVGASAAIQTFVSQRHGAGRDEECGSWSWQGLAANVPPAAAGALLVLLCADAIVDLLAPTETIAPLTTGYMRARALGLPGLTAAVAISSFFRGIGDTRTPLYVTLVVNAVNLLLDFGLVFGLWGLPQLGVVGAGLATSIAEWLYVGLMGAFFLRPALAARYHTRFARPRLAEIRRLARIGIPIGGQWVLEMLSFAVFVTLVARMGEAQMAASHAFIQLLSLSFMQASGISTAAATLVGRAIGAGRPDRVERSYRASLLLAGVLGALIAALFVLAPNALVGIFTDDPDVLAYARPLLMIGAAFQLMDALGIVTDGALRGAGDTRWPFAVRCLFSWLVFLPFAWWLAFPLEQGLTGAWLGGLVYIALLSPTLLWRFRSQAWRRIQI